MGNTTFDFAGLKRAFETLDIPSLITNYADDAEWIEYQSGASITEPHRLVGKEVIHKRAQGVADRKIKLEISDEVIGDGCIAYCMRITAPDGRKGIENAIIYHQDGKIIRQFEVEAWE
jgi:hypothetical protein